MKEAPILKLFDVCAIILLALILVYLFAGCNAHTIPAIAQPNEETGMCLSNEALACDKAIDCGLISQDRKTFCMLCAAMWVAINSQVNVSDYIPMLKDVNCTDAAKYGKASGILPCANVDIQ